MRIFRLGFLSLLVAFTALGCGQQQPGARRAGSAPVPATPSIDPGKDASLVYNQMGLIATSGPISYVGKIAYFAAENPDTTVLLASISLSNRMLSFVRDGDSYRAPYEVRLKLTQGTAEVKSIDVMEIVRVATFKEVNRTDESVIFQNYFRIPPGEYGISFTVRDVGSNRTATQEGIIIVPRLSQGNLSTPLLVYDAKRRTALDSLPRILASPRSSAVFGRDSTVSVYLEAYGGQQQVPVSFAVQNDKGAVMWRDTMVLERLGNLMSGSVTIPISRVGIGIASVTFIRSDAADTVRIPVFVSFGNSIPLLSYEELLNQLRYYVSPERLRVLRNAPVDQRGAVWAAFLRDSDPSPSTPEHEGLQTYFSRLQLANIRFRDEGISRSGWLSDRARVYVLLGEPDQLYDQNINSPLSRTSVSQRGRVQYWEYTQYHVRLVFYDDTGTGRWRLTPSSEIEFQNLNARLLVH